MPGQYGVSWWSAKWVSWARKSDLKTWGQGCRWEYQQHSDSLGINWWCVNQRRGHERQCNLSLVINPAGGSQLPCHSLQRGPHGEELRPRAMWGAILEMAPPTPLKPSDDVAPAEALLRTSGEILSQGHPWRLRAWQKRMKQGKHSNKDARKAQNGTKTIRKKQNKNNNWVIVNFEQCLWKN